MAFSTTNPGIQTVRVPLLANNTKGLDFAKGQEFLNGFFELIPNHLTGENDYFFIKRPGLATLFSPATNGPGRGCFAWWKTGNVYSVNNNKIYANATDLGVTMQSISGLCNFTTTRPGATTQYLGVNDGQALYLIAADNSVIVMNNVTITSSSVANPTTITANNHNLQTGNKVIIRNHVGSTPNINDTIFTITRTGANTFTIPVNVTVGGTGGTIGVFPFPNTSDLQFMDGYWFTMKLDGSVWNCSVDDPTTWPATSFINTQMLPTIGVGLGRQHNVLLAFGDQDVQMFYDAANPVGSPLANIEEAMQRVGCVGSGSIASNENTTYWVSNTATGGMSVYRLDGTSNLKDIGSPQVRRSITNNGSTVNGPSNQVRIILTSGTTWTVPSDFNTSNNTIEAIGGGGGGASGFTSGPNNAGGGGGGGGGYSKITNFTPGGSTVSYSIGSGGTGAPAGGGGTAAAGGDTTFNTSSVVAKGGAQGIAGVGGAGGAAASGTGSTKFSGGAGGNGASGPGNNDGQPGGGGGAAGLNANGNAGANATTSAAGVGGQGDGTAGGVGGSGSQFNGANGAEWVSAGSGGGGYQSGNGGLYGAAGAGGAQTKSGGGVINVAGGGNGSQGVIVITYTPTSPAVVSSLSAYILRIDGHIYYVLNLFNQGETWVYDQDLDMWTKWSDTTGTAIWPVLDTAQFLQPNSAPIIAGQDLITGKIWQVSNTLYQDNGTNFNVQVTTIPIDFDTKARKYWHRLEPITDLVTSSTLLNISYSDTDYTSFSTPRGLDISQIRPFTVALGNSRRRIWRLSYSDNFPLRVYGLEFGVEMEMV